MKILITGGAGFIGSYLSNKLSKNHEIHVVDNSIRGDYSRLNDGIKIFNIDLTKIDQLKKVDNNYDFIFHLAAINGTDNFYNNHHKVFEVGTKSIINIYDHFKYQNSKIITASSAEVYQKPEIIPTDEKIQCIIPDITNHRYSYGGSKIFSELLVFNYGIDYFKSSMIFRPHNIYGPNMGYKHVIPQLIEKIKRAISEKNHSIQLIGDGSETRAFCYIDDLINGLEILIKDGVDKNVYHIGNDYEISILDLLKKIIKIMGVNIDIVKGENTHEGGTNRRCPNISKIKKLGYNPKFDLDKGLNLTIQWYLNNENNYSNKLI
jgi:UDP-glucose 4-epimerase